MIDSSSLSVSPAKRTQYPPGYTYNCFPVRHARRNLQDNGGAWLVEYRAKKKKDVQNDLQKQIVKLKNKQKQKQKPEFVNHLTPVYLVKHCCVEDPKDVCKINISGKKLHGIKKEDFSLFENVAYVDASDNNLYFECFASFPKLEELHLQVNNISKLSLHTDTFLCLKTLDLSYNPIEKEVLLTLGKLRCLSTLNLQGCELEKLPPELARGYVSSQDDDAALQRKCERKRRFPELETLNLSENCLTDISTFASVAGLRKLKTLILSRNKITSVPHLRLMVAHRHFSLSSINTDVLVNDLSVYNATIAVSSDVDSSVPPNNSKVEEGEVPAQSEIFKDDGFNGPHVIPLNSDSTMSEMSNKTSELSKTSEISSKISRKVSTNTDVLITIKELLDKDEKSETFQNQTDLDLHQFLTEIDSKENELLTESDESKTDELLTGKEEAKTDGLLTKINESKTDGDIDTTGAAITVGKDQTLIENDGDKLDKDKLDAVEKLLNGDNLNDVLPTKTEEADDLLKIDFSGKEINFGLKQLEDDLGLSLGATHEGNEEKYVDDNDDLLNDNIKRPFPLLELLDLSHNEIRNEESLLALTAFPALRQLNVWGNPLMKAHVNIPVVLRHHLQTMCGIKVCKKDPAPKISRKPIAPVLASSAKHHRIDTYLPPIKRNNLVLIEAQLTNALEDKKDREVEEDRPAQSPPRISHQAEQEDFKEAEERYEGEQVFLTQVDEEGYDDDDVVEHEETIETDNNEHLPPKYEGYELLLKSDDEELDEIIFNQPLPTIQGSVKALKLMLKHPLMFKEGEYNEKKVELTKNKKKKPSRLKPVKHSSSESSNNMDVVTEALDYMKTDVTSYTQNLADVLENFNTDPVIRKKFPKVKGLMKNVQKKYDEVRLNSLRPVSRAQRDGSCTSTRASLPSQDLILARMKKSKIGDLYGGGSRGGTPRTKFRGTTPMP